MKKYTFVVEFTDQSDVVIRAFGKEEAKIVAQANRIQAGLIYSVERIYKIQD